MQHQTDILIIGAGQAGLAMGYYLAQGNRSFAILDSAPEIGHSWLTRYDSLKLFTPTQYNHLPGWDFPGAADEYPTKDQVVDYLQQYAERFHLPVHLNTSVRRLTRQGAQFRLETNQGVYLTSQVVVATGPFQRPFTPAFAADLLPDVRQMHTSLYRNPQQLNPGPVLVVGGGNSGVQIADELSRDRQVYLAIGKQPPMLPQRVLGQDLFWWLHRLGLMKVSATSRLGTRLRQHDPLIGTDMKRLAQRVEFVPRAIGVKGAEILLAEGRALAVPNVIWATGFRPDYRWIDIPGVQPDQTPAHVRGVSDIPGLHFLGLPWQHTRGSALLGGVGADAEYLSKQIQSTRGESYGRASYASVGS